MSESTPVIPDEVGKVTNEYLEEKLGLGKIKNFSVNELGVQGNASTVKKLIVEFENGSDSKKSIILKMTGPVVAPKAAPVLRTGEFMMYSILEKLEFSHYPEIYYKEIDPKTTNFIFLMEDAGLRGEVKTVVSVEESKLVMKTLAQLQNETWNRWKDKNYQVMDEHFLADDFCWFGLFHCDRESVKESYEENGKKILSLMESTLKDFVVDDPKDLEFLEKINYGKHFEESMRKMFDPSRPQVIVHGDCRPDNMSFNLEKSELLIFDWQMGRLGNPLNDINQFFCMAEIEKCENWGDYENLIRYYYESLDEKIRAEYTYERILDEFRAVNVFQFFVMMRLFKKPQIEMIEKYKPELYKIFYRTREKMIMFLRHFY